MNTTKSQISPPFPSNEQGERRQTSGQIYRSEDGTVRAWIEQDISIHLKATTELGDPVELAASEARLLAKILLQYADCIDP